MNITALIMIVVTVVGAAFLIFVLIRNQSLEEIRTEVYQLFLQAEHCFTGSKEGRQKMAWVLGKARLLLPGWMRAFISEELLEHMIEGWFKAVKDLLDDGKYNHSPVEAAGDIEDPDNRKTDKGEERGGYEV